MPEKLNLDEIKKLFSALNIPISADKKDLGQAKTRWASGEGRTLRISDMALFRDEYANTNRRLRIFEENLESHLEIVYTEFRVRIIRALGKKKKVPGPEWGDTFLRKLNADLNLSSTLAKSFLDRFLSEKGRRHDIGSFHDGVTRSLFAWVWKKAIAHPYIFGGFSISILAAVYLSGESSEKPRSSAYMDSLYQVCKGLADSLNDENRKEEALEKYEELYRISRTAKQKKWALGGMGIIQRQRGMNDDLRVTVAKLLALDPKNRVGNDLAKYLSNLQ
jgi:hypothetical protein